MTRILHMLYSFHHILDRANEFWYLIGKINLIGLVRRSTFGVRLNFTGAPSDPRIMIIEVYFSDERFQGGARHGANTTSWTRKWYSVSCCLIFFPRSALRKKFADMAYRPRSIRRSVFDYFTLLEKTKSFRIRKFSPRANNSSGWLLLKYTYQSRACWEYFSSHNRVSIDMLVEISQTPFLGPG